MAEANYLERRDIKARCLGIRRHRHFSVLSVKKLYGLWVEPPLFELLAFCQNNVF